MRLVETALGSFLSDIAAADHTLLAGFHLIGSATQSDFQPHSSDIDFVAVLSRTATALDLAMLADVHLAYVRRSGLPLLDGIWVTQADLIAGPMFLVYGPATQDS